MKRTEFDARMRALEYFHNLKAPLGNFIIIRVDGHGFSKLTEKHYKKPFDPELKEAMKATTLALMKEFKPLYGYFESDEISLLFSDDYVMYDREVEKMVSLTAGRASSAFTQASGHDGHFDSRMILAPNEDVVIDYFLWRQADSARNCVNTICYWEQVLGGVTKKKAAKNLFGATLEEKKKILEYFNINLEEIPRWQRFGVGIYNEVFQKEGFNPKTQEKVVVNRNRWKVDEELPQGFDYDNLLWKLLQVNESEQIAKEATL